MKIMSFAIRRKNIDPFPGIHPALWNVILNTGKLSRYYKNVSLENRGFEVADLKVYSHNGETKEILLSVDSEENVTLNIDEKQPEIVYFLNLIQNGELTLRSFNGDELQIIRLPLLRENDRYEFVRKIHKTKNFLYIISDVNNETIVSQWNLNGEEERYVFYNAGFLSYYTKTRLYINPYNENMVLFKIMVSSRTHDFIEQHLFNIGPEGGKRVFRKINTDDFNSTGVVKYWHLFLDKDNCVIFDKRVEMLGETKYVEYQVPQLIEPLTRQGHIVIFHDPVNRRLLANDISTGELIKIFEIVEYFSSQPYRLFIFDRKIYILVPVDNRNLLFEIKFQGYENNVGRLVNIIGNKINDDLTPGIINEELRRQLRQRQTEPCSKC